MNRSFPWGLYLFLHILLLDVSLCFIKMSKHYRRYKSIENSGSKHAVTFPSINTHHIPIVFCCCFRPSHLIIFPNLDLLHPAAKSEIRQLDVLLWIHRKSRVLTYKAWKWFWLIHVLIHHTQIRLCVFSDDVIIFPLKPNWGLDTIAAICKRYCDVHFLE